MSLRLKFDAPKHCNGCNTSKDRKEFYPLSQGSTLVRSRCIVCVRGGNARWRGDNRDRHRTLSRKWNARHPDQVSSNNGAWAKANPEKVRAKRKRYLDSHESEWDRRSPTDVQYKLRVNLRARLHQAAVNGSKAGSAVRDLGCTIPELKTYLESKFYPHPITGEEMTWENWSPTGWHVDHKKPLKLFDLTDREQVLQACHYTNLQPLWAEQNLAKGAKDGTKCSAM